jgi:hypothetical protein
MIIVMMSSKCSSNTRKNIKNILTNSYKNIAKCSVIRTIEIYRY